MQRNFINTDPQASEIGHMQYTCPACQAKHNVMDDTVTITEHPTSGVAVEVDCPCGKSTREFTPFG